jgi:hypothetical protein
MSKLADDALRNELLEQSGYFAKIKSRGPFVIGTDFEAPGPAGRLLPSISPSKDTLDKLEKCLARGKSSHAGRVADGKNDFLEGIRDVLSRYVSDYHFQPEESKVRRELRSLRAAINKFKSRLPTNHDPVGRFLFDTYTGSSILRDELQPSDDELIALQDAWRKHFGFRAISQKLDVMLRNVLAAEECLGKSKPRNHRVKALVRALAEIWQDKTGHWPKSGRNPESAAQSGPFADFVRTACDAVPKPIIIEQKALGTAIREVCEHGPRNFPA